MDHAEEEIRNFLGDIKEILFIPYALQNHVGYAQKVRERFEKMGVALRSIHEMKDARASIKETKAFFVGGGNTFCLLDELQRQHLLEPIREQIQNGACYLGASAGINITCPTIRTTNDMPIVQPGSFAALGLIPFQINPHYLDPDTNSKHMGETREQRIREFHERNETPVLGLREGAWLRIEGKQAKVAGLAGARLFRKGQDPREFQSGESLDFLLNHES